MGKYEEAFRALNDAQRQAVETIDGPVLVVAGPGTGKTQLLSVRVANILKTAPGVLPSNILCLTFTDSAAANLRERLIEKIGLGQDAYQVAIHTFNSFGSWIMTTYPEYFFEWREAATADELTSYRIIESILAKLPGDHPLAAQSYDDSFFALKQVRNFIGDCKRANLSPEATREVLKANTATYVQLGGIINEHWPSKMTDKGALDAVATCIAELEKASAKTDEPTADITPLPTLLLQQLHAAQAESAALDGRSKTKPFTAWKDDWLELDDNKKWVFKAAKHADKLWAATEIYDQYQIELERAGLVDFNDQIVVVLAALAKHEALRLNLQERFQYIMVDEFQDTNRAQLQMARFLTDAAVHEGRPNIMVVGDDDQAIYRFQGADMSNVAAFESTYDTLPPIRLSENYRSNEDVLTRARSISGQIALSLEKQKGISKELGINVSKKGVGTQLHEFAHETEHYAWVAAEIKRLVDAGHIGKEIAVLARQRDQLDALVPYLRDQQVPIDYERRENVLEQEHVVALITLVRLIHSLAEQRLGDANALLPEILSHPMWNISPGDIWHVAQQAHTDKRLWLDIIFDQENTRAREVADFLFTLSQRSADMPFEQVLDALIGLEGAWLAGPAAFQDGPGGGRPGGAPAERNGVSTVGEVLPDRTPHVDFTSPFKQYYFGADLFNEQPARYLTLLSHLSCLRRHLRNYQQGSTAILHVADLIQFVDAYTRANLTMVDTAAHREDASAVRLMTTHKAKGQEFDTVFIIGVENNVWKNTGGGNQRFSYPRNLAEIKPSDNDADDALRLLFVAMTRARQNLHICYFKQSEEGKGQQLFAPLLALEIESDMPDTPADSTALAAQYEQRWLTRHAGVEQADKHALLAPKLERYQLSATHFGNFLDVTRGGPLYFLTQNLLHFPSSTSPQACYGIIVHETLRHAHEQVQRGEKPSVTQLVAYFKTKLQAQPMSEHDLAQLLHRGEEHLRTFLAAELAGFTATQRTEVDFKNQGATIGEARLTGSLDLIDFDPDARTIMITDYKTGKPFSKWDLPPSSPERDRIKLHRYRQQLLFYKLLVDHSSDWGSKGWSAETGVIQFVEPDLYGKLRVLVADYSAEEIDHTKHLIQAVWRHIQDLDFPDVSETYGQDLAGILQFEADLIA